MKWTLANVRFGLIADSCAAKYSPSTDMRMDHYGPANDNQHRKKTIHWRSWRCDCCMAARRARAAARPQAAHRRVDGQYRDGAGPELYCHLFRAARRDGMGERS